MTTLSEHLKERGILSSHDVIIDEDSRTATFLLYSQIGKLQGFQTYKPDAPKYKPSKEFNPRDLRYFTHAVSGELPMFGTETLSYNPHYVFLVEGVFDAVKFHALGHPCLAVLGNDPVRLRSFLSAISRRVVGFCDNDAAGRRLASSCDWFYFAPNKDAGEMTKHELYDYLIVGSRYHFVDGEICEF